MGRVTRRAPAQRVGADGVGLGRRVETLAVEEPLELRVLGRSLTTTMRTPGHDIELVHGFLLGEGVITRADQVLTARYCAGDAGDGNTYNLLDLAFSPGVVVPDGVARAFTTTSSCGVCGTESIDALMARGGPDLSAVSVRYDAQVLLDLPRRLREGQQVFGSTGGVHAAGLFTAEGEPLIIREDVGRHNALDKVLGRALLDEMLPATGHVLAVSGRVSFELVQKAWAAGIPALVAVSAPSSLAVELAHRAGITLMAFVRESGGNLYAHGDRVELLSDQG